MGYALYLYPSWEKSYKKLDVISKERAHEALLKIVENPYIGKPLSANLKGIWSFRFGTFRILYQINESEKEIFINALGLRKNVYD